MMFRKYSCQASSSTLMLPLAICWQPTYPSGFPFAFSLSPNQVIIQSSPINTWMGQCGTAIDNSTYHVSAQRAVSQFVCDSTSACDPTSYSKVLPPLAGDNVLARSQTFSTPPPPPSFPTPTSNHKFPKNVPSAIWVNSLGQKMGDAVVVQPFLLTVLMCTR